MCPKPKPGVDIGILKHALFHWASPQEVAEVVHHVKCLLYKHEDQSPHHPHKMPDGHSSLPIVLAPGMPNLDKMRDPVSIHIRFRELKRTPDGNLWLPHTCAHMYIHILVHLSHLPVHSHMWNTHKHMDTQTHGHIHTWRMRSVTVKIMLSLSSPLHFSFILIFFFFSLNFHSSHIKLNVFVEIRFFSHTVCQDHWFSSLHLFLLPPLLLLCLWV